MVHWRTARVHRRTIRRATTAHGRAHGGRGTTTATADTTSGKVARTLVMSPLSGSCSGPVWSGRPLGGSVGHAGRGASLAGADRPTRASPPRRERAGTAAYRQGKGPRVTSETGTGDDGGMSAPQQPGGDPARDA